MTTLVHDLVEFQYKLSIMKKEMEGNEPATTFENSEIPWPRSLRFWLLLIFEIPAVSATLFVLFFILSTRTARTALHNHTTIVLLILALIFQLIDIPWYMSFLQTGIVTPQTPAHCLVWWFVDLGVYNTVSIVLAWMSIERHILVFHDRWVASHRRRILFHYLPLNLILIYASVYYVWLIFFPPCQHNYAYEFVVCSATPCHLLDPILSIWEMGIHGCLMTLIITCFSVGLLIRVIVKKRFHYQIFQWRKYRKMIIQLLSLSIVYLAFNLPIMVIWLARSWGVSAEAIAPAQLISFFLTYWVMLLLPIVSLISLTDIEKKLRHIICPMRRNQITASFSAGNMSMRINKKPSS